VRSKNAIIDGIIFLENFSANHITDRFQSDESLIFLFLALKVDRAEKFQIVT